MYPLYSMWNIALTEFLHLIWDTEALHEFCIIFTLVSGITNTCSIIIDLRTYVQCVHVFSTYQFDPHKGVVHISLYCGQYWNQAGDIF